MRRVDMRKSFILLVSIVFLISIWGCSNSNDSNNTETSATNEGSSQATDFFTSQGLKVLNKIDVNGDPAWLCEFTGKYTEGTGLAGDHRGPTSKKCMILTGKPYNIGYQAATLMPEQAYAMCSTFMRRTALGQLSLLGIDLSEENAVSNKVYEILYAACTDMANVAEPDIPEYLREEMHGFADGMSAAGHPDVDYNKVLILNQAVDAVYFLLAAVSGHVPVTDENRDLVNKLKKYITEILVTIGTNNPDLATYLENLGPIKFPQWGCNEFAVTGAATVDGKTYHGRDFMFGTTDIYQDSACMAVYIPDRGHPFATVTVPGFVGQSLGMNTEGLSMGQDVCLVGVGGLTPGVGSMLVVRDVVQNCSTLDEAVNEVRYNLSRGMSWIFFVADDDYDSRWGNAVELEVITNQRDIKGPETLLPLTQLLMAPWIEKLDDDQLVNGYINNGVMVRSMKWTYPENFINEQRLDVKNLEAYNTYYKKGIHFPVQHENDPEVLAATNHFTIPRLTMLHYDWLTYLGYFLSGQFPQSVWRYENMETYIDTYKGKINFFGDGDTPSTGSAGWIIDFLNTQRDYPWFYQGEDYSKPVNTPVDGHHAVMDNDDKVMMGLYGYMTDPWVKINLMDFVNWFKANQ